MIHRTVISKEIAVLLRASWCIYVYDYFTEVHLGEVNFGELSTKDNEK